MKIGVLTSSRADYGIYLPLLNKIKDDCFFELEIIAFDWFKGVDVLNSKLCSIPYRRAAYDRLRLSCKLT